MIHRQKKCKLKPELNTTEQPLWSGNEKAGQHQVLARLRSQCGCQSPPAAAQVCWTHRGGLAHAQLTAAPLHRERYTQQTCPHALPERPSGITCKSPKLQRLETQILSAVELLLHHRSSWSRENDGTEVTHKHTDQPLKKGCARQEVLLTRCSQRGKRGGVTGRDGCDLGGKWFLGYV